MTGVELVMMEEKAARGGTDNQRSKHAQ